MKRETFKLSQKELQRVAVISACVSRCADTSCSEDARGYFRLLRRLLRCTGIPWSLYGDKHSVFVRNDKHWTVDEQLAGRRQPTQFGRALEQLGITYIAAIARRPRGVSRGSGAPSRTLCAARCAWPRPPISTLPTGSCANSCRVQPPLRSHGPTPRRPGALLPASWIASAASCIKRVVSKRQRRAVAGTPLPDSSPARRFSFAGARVQLYENLEGNLALYYRETKLQHIEG